MRSIWTTLAVVLALVGGLLLLGVAPGAPTAVACEKHEDDCRVGGHGEPPAAARPLTIRGTVLFVGALRTFDAQLRDGRVSGQVAINGQPADPVVEIVPPGGARDYYCVRVDPADDPPNTSSLTYLVRDVGNGVTTFDQIGGGFTIPPATCSDTPASGFVPVVAGNITVTR